VRGRWWVGDSAVRRRSAPSECVWLSGAVCWVSTLQGVDGAAVVLSISPLHAQAQAPSFLTPPSSPSPLSPHTQPPPARGGDAHDGHSHVARHHAPPGGAPVAAGGGDRQRAEAGGAAGVAAAPRAERLRVLFGDRWHEQGEVAVEEGCAGGGGGSVCGVEVVWDGKERRSAG